MIDIYTEKKESKDWIIQNDLYFNFYIDRIKDLSIKKDPR